MHKGDLTELRNRAAATQDLQQQNDLMVKILSEERQQRELKFKILAFWLSIAAFCLTATGVAFQIIHSNRLRQQEISQRQKDYSVKFYEKQMQVYSELSDVISRITVLNTPTIEQFQEFDELIAGKILLFADKSVRHHSIALNHLLKLEAGLTKETQEDERIKASIPNLVTDSETLSLMILNDCRSSLKKAFPEINIGAEIDEFHIRPKR